MSTPKQPECTLAVHLEPTFVESEKGKLLVVRYRAQSAVDRGHAIIIFPSFAEEANHSRRMVALQARQLAERGYSVLVPDLFGTGDSQGDFADATWSAWRNDIDAIFSLVKSMGMEKISVLALRAGALLAADYLAQHAYELEKLVLWHPCTNGLLYLRQFLRLRLVADMLSTGDKKETANSLLDQLREGEPVEVAGYMLNPALVLPLADINLEQCYPQKNVLVRWLEVVPESQTDLSIPGKKSVEAWRVNGLQVDEAIVFGSQFWATQEITTAPSLLTETSSFFVA